MARNFLNGISTNAFRLGTSTTSGYVLTADSSGNGTWQVSASGSYLPLAGGSLIGNLAIANSSSGDVGVNIANGSGGQYTQSGFKVYNSASTIGNNGGVFLGSVITDVGATQSSVVLNQIDKTGAYVRGLWNIDLAAQLMSVNMTMYPLANNTFNNGSTAAYWANLYATRLNVNSTAYIDGATPGILALNGTLNIASGAGASKVLTSDASGNATWQTPTGGGSGIVRNISTVTTTVTVGATASTDYVVFIGASGVVTLPTAVGNTNQYTLKNVDTTNKTVSTTSSQTIDGSTTITLTPNTTVDCVSDGTNWRIV